MYNHDYPMHEHDFEKQNLVSIIKGGRIYDHYKCKNCGCEGKRYELSSFVVGRVRNNHKPKPRCTTPKVVEFKQRKVQIIAELMSFGIKKGQTYDTVACPSEYSYNPDMVASIWVFSKQRNEHCRLLPTEYKFIND